MEETQYWCHMCSQRVNPVIEIETIKCPICESGFVEEMSSAVASETHTPPLDLGLEGGSDSDHAMSLWAEILLGMMSNRRRHRHRMRRMDFDDDENNDENDNHHDYQHGGGAGGDMESEERLEHILRRTRRNSAAILQLLQGIQDGIPPSESLNSDTDRDRERDRDEQHVILINPFNQTMVVQGSHNSTSGNRATMGSLGDYFMGPGLDMLLQHLAENDPNRYGTPPAQKEAVEALPTVKLEETVQCSVCLDECEVGAEVKEMPCKHKFHSSCILPWLELHSSCPICRHQLPFDETKLQTEGTSRNNTSSNTDDENNNGGEGRQFSVPLPWPFSSLFSSTDSRSNRGNSSGSNTRPE